MDRSVIRERMRKKQRQIRRRKIIKLVTYVVAMVLAVIFVIRGVIFPIVSRIGGKSTGESQQVQADAEQTADPTAAQRQPLKGQSDLTKISTLTPGWHEDDNGRWYQNADGTYYTGGFAEIDGVTYAFDDNGYMQTGWVTKGSQDYYFNDDGSYNASEKRPMIALTFDDGPGEYTSELLDCLEENNAHATFFMLGQNVQNYQDDVKRMLELGCEIGNHSWDHANMYELSLDSVVKEFNDADQALIDACGQASTVVRAPYGNANEDIMNAVGKPFFMWSLDSLDWKYKDVDLDYKSIMQDNSSVIKDGTIILMHDIHEPSVKAAERIIPELINMGFKLVTVSEMAEAKNVTLQNASYNNFWQDILDQGLVPGYAGNSTSDADTSDGTEDSSDGSEDGSGSDGSEDYSDGSEDGSNSSE
ncbi:MAG: polysaccharide deacetylase family protein [Blautia sp.]|nr:polysaccharide deacetylase family protein [Blautia sp.]